MSKTLFSLDTIRVASPCRASWDDMEGDDRARFCSLCQQTVYNLSGMSRAEALDLVQQEEGRRCIRFYRRADGTLLTTDCPVGVRAWRRRLIAGCVAGVALVTALLFGAFTLVLGTGQGGGPRGKLLQRVWVALFPPPPGAALALPGPAVPVGQPQFVLGAMCPPEIVVPAQAQAVGPE